jgi:hypothetical protein
MAKPMMKGLMVTRWIGRQIVARALQLPDAGMGLTIFIPEFVHCTIVAT